MATDRKVQQVALLEERLQRATITIGLDYRGLSVGEMQTLRRAIQAEAPESELRVIKNSLFARAAANVGMADAAQIAQESTALLLGYGELTEAPRALRLYLRGRNRDVPVHGVRRVEACRRVLRARVLQDLRLPDGGGAPVQHLWAARPPRRG